MLTYLKAIKPFVTAMKMTLKDWPGMQSTYDPGKYEILHNIITTIIKGGSS